LPAFDVVSIKPHKDEGMMMRAAMRFTPDGVEIDGMPLQILVRQAFGMSEDRILNEPDWVKSGRIDLEAKVAPEDAAKLEALSTQQRYAMLLPILQDRCGLKFHHETKELQVYALVVGKGGPKLKESAPKESAGDSSATPAVPAGASGAPGGGGALAPKSSAAGSGGSVPKGRMTMRMSQQGMELDAKEATMEQLSQLISQQISATVVDKTGLTGKYDLTLSFLPDNMMLNGHMMRPDGGAGGDGGAQAQEPVGPSVFTAVQEQLGLKLEAEKQAVDVIVIDHIEQPSAN
jgi:uncharacterized protein (TIGR03435 family)